MAIDEAILRGVAERTSPPTLRLYGWSPPALTLGRGQPVADADVDALARAGITLMRRMTGGTAVLNRDELTYMAAATSAEPRFSGNIAESYRGISAALLLALERLGLTLAEAMGRGEAGNADNPRTGSRPRSPVCFEIPSDYEVTVGGRKLVGSSQMRVRGGVLQHGSLPLWGDMGAISRFLVAQPDPDRIRSLALTLADALNRRVSWQQAAQALVAGFSEGLNLILVPGPLTGSERALTERLVAEKYGNEDWTARL
jgi:lipoate-protein ligase A